MIEGDGFSIAARNVPAHFVAGDFFDVLRHEDGSVGIVIADVSGKGIGASLIMASVKAVLPFVEMPRPLQEAGVIGKGGAAGFLGKAYDPYRLYQDPNKPIKLDDLTLRKDVSPDRLKDRFTMLKGINGSMPDLEKALKDYAIDEYYGKAFDLVLSGKAREAFDLSKEPDKVRERYGRTTFGQGLLLSRRLIEAGTRFVQMNWPAVANGNPEVDAWDTHFFGSFLDRSS